MNAPVRNGVVRSFAHARDSADIARPYARARGRIARDDSSPFEYPGDFIHPQGRCGWCGAELPVQVGVGRTRYYCSETCRKAAHRQRSHAAGPAGLEDSSESPRCQAHGCDRPAVAEAVAVRRGRRGRVYCEAHARLAREQFHRLVRPLAFCGRCHERHGVMAAVRFQGDEEARPLCGPCAELVRSLIEEPS